MKKSLKRLGILALCLLLVLAMAPVALAAGDVTVAVESNAVFNETSSGTASVVVDITNDTDQAVDLVAVRASGGCVVSASASATIPAKSVKTVVVTATLSEIKSSYSTTETGNLVFSFNTSPADKTSPIEKLPDKEVKASFKRYEKAPETPKIPEPEVSDVFAFVLSRTDAEGFAVPAPEGEHGDEVLVRLPLLCREGVAYDVRVTPVTDTDVEKYPFDITLVDDSLQYAGMVGQGGIIEFQYHWQLSEKATKGMKKVDFNISYRDALGALHEGKVSVFVNVTKGAATDEEDVQDTAVPKVIIDSYTLPEKIYAGETFTLDFTLRNTSSKEAVRNLQISVKDAAATATVLPASGGSNSLYVERIGKGETEKLSIQLQTSPAAEAKAYTMMVDFSYEAGEKNTTYTPSETITIPILQEIRIKCDDPVLYDDVAWLDQSSAMYLRLYNMGKSTIYNCQIQVEGEGLKMEESYFGGNLQSGATLSADFNVIPSVAGQIDAAVVVIYEDNYGEASEIRLPFVMTVEGDVYEDVPPDMMDYPMEPMPAPSRGGMPWWIFAIAGVVVVAVLLVVLLKVKRKKRRRSLEEEG